MMGQASGVQSDKPRFSAASWATLGAALLLLALSLALTLYRLTLPTDGRSTFDDPEPGLTRDYEGTAVLVAVDDVPVEEIVWGAVTLRPRRPANWAVGQMVRYTIRQGEREFTQNVILRRSFASLDRSGWWHWLNLPRLALQLLIGLFVFFRRPRSPATRLLFLYGLFPVAALITRSVTQGWNEIRLADYFYPGAFWPTLIFGSLEDVIFPLLLHFFLIFPVVKLPMRHYPRLTLSAIYGSTLVAAAIWNPGQPFAFLLGRFSFLIFLIWMLLIVSSLAVTLGHTLLTMRDPIGQAQMRWIAWGITVPGVNWLLILLVFLVAFLARELGVTDSIVQPLVKRAVELLYGVGAFTNLAFPLALAMALLRYRLFDIDTLLNRTLVYGALTVIVIGLYVLVVGSLGALFQAGGNLLLSILATGLIAILFQPLRQWLQRSVNHLLYGQRDQPYTVLSRLGQRLEATLAPDAVLPTIVTTVKEALKLPYAAIALDQEGRSVEVAAAGTPAPNPLCLPLLYQGETIGQLILAPRALGEAFTPAERRLLDDLAHQAGVAAAAVRLTADLQRSRERLVTAREEERRRLRRDLHDGLGPQLASLTLKLDAARNLLAQGDSTQADRLLLELKTQTQAAIADIRRLVHNLRPPALDELGLVSALREYTAYHAANGLQIRLEAPEPLPPLPAAVELAAYRIALEALTNVTRHAHARQCVIRLALDEALGLEILDDGLGLPEGYQAGVGLTSMRERAAELGGMCQIESLPGGGTRVRARLPLTLKT